MLFQSFIIAALLALACLLGGRPAMAAEDKGEKALVLTQLGDVFGNSVCYINKRAIKIVVEDGKAYLLASAPKWDVVFCNDTSKTALKMSLDAWLKHIVQVSYMGNDWDRYELVLKRKYDLDKDGRKYVRYTIAGLQEKGRVVSCTAAANAEYLVLKDTEAAEQACHIMEKALSAPRVAAVPIEFVSHSKSLKVTGYARVMGGDQHWLSTLKTREELVPSGFFNYPAGYKLVKKEVEVLNDSQRKQHIDDLVKDLLPSH